MELFSVEDCEKLILGNYYRLQKFGIDRRGDALAADRLDPATGLPLSASDLAPMSRAKTGTALAMESLCEPRNLAISHLSLSFVPKDKWDPEDVGLVNELEHRFKIAMLHLADRGLMNLKPVLDFDQKEATMGADGLPWVGKITTRGLDEARRTIPGTKLERGPVSILADAPAEIRANAPQHFREQFSKEG